MLEKLFGWGKKKAEPSSSPNLSFGRYSDNNKPVAKVNRWSEADNLFKEKKYTESFDAFFDYLRDDAAANVVYERNGATGRFEIYQGSKVVRGNFTGEEIKAEVTLARMPQPSIPVMRRLLEMNFTLFYNRFALDNERLCMRFDSDLPGASPSKLYYGLKELATKADKQDDLLVQDFTILERTDTDHIVPIPDAEQEVKYTFLLQWIQQTVETIQQMDAEKFSGGIAYILLALIYKIDYLIAPEGKLLYDLEKIATIYTKKDERPVPEKNRDMLEAFQQMLALPKATILSCLFRSKYTFSIVAPQEHKAIAEAVHIANQNMVWYRDNQYPDIAAQISEYGITYCQYTYSLPRVLTDLIQLFMNINYPAYFTALGYNTTYYTPQQNQFDRIAIIEKIKTIQNNWKAKYPNMDFKTQNLRFDNLPVFNLTFTNEIEFLNMEPK